MEEVNPSQSADAEQPHSSVNHSRPFFYVQPPTQPYFMYQWPMDPFGQYGFPGPSLPFGRPLMTPYQYMPLPGYVVPHAPMQPTDYRRLAPFMPSIASYDIRLRQHLQQMSVCKEMSSAEAQTEPADPVCKLTECLKGLRSCEEEKELNMRLSSTPAVTSSTNGVEKRNLGPASGIESVEQNHATTSTALADSAIYESSQGRLEESVLSDVLPLDSSSVDENQDQDDQQSDGETQALSGRTSATHTTGIFSNYDSVQGQDSGTHVSDVSVKSAENKIVVQSPQTNNLESIDLNSLVKTNFEYDLPYQILRLPCDKSTTDLGEIGAMACMDPMSTFVSSKKISLNSKCHYSYYPPVAPERQSVLSPSLDELSSRDEMFSTDVDDDLVTGQVYVEGDKPAETSLHSTSFVKNLDDSCSLCAYCGTSLPDEEVDIFSDCSGYADKDGIKDCGCELGEDVPSAAEATVRPNSRQGHPSNTQVTKPKARKVQAFEDLVEERQGLIKRECNKPRHIASKNERFQGTSQKSDRSKSSLEHFQRKETELVDRENWTSSIDRQRSKSCRSAEGHQEKGRPVYGRPSCKMFAQHRQRRNEYDDHTEMEFSHCQRGRGSMKRRGTRY